jgi:hypothetical protein
MYVYTRMIFAAVLSPAIKIFHRHLGPNLLIFAVKVSPTFYGDFMTYHRHFTAKKHRPWWFLAKTRCACCIILWRVQKTLWNSKIWKLWWVPTENGDSRIHLGKLQGSLGIKSEYMPGVVWLVNIQYLIVFLHMIGWSKMKERLHDRNLKQDINVIGCYCITKSQKM